MSDGPGHGAGPGGIPEHLLRPADPAGERVVGDRARQAVASLRGYAYQVYASAIAWLDLAPGSELYLEVAEDFAVAASGSLDAVQVKDTQGTISLASRQARDVISAFVRLTGDNPGRKVRFVLLTTSKVTVEHRIDLRTGDVPGIHRWKEAAGGGDLGDLRDVLLRLDVGPEAFAFVRDRDDDRLRQDLLRRIEWRCGEGHIDDLAERFRERVAELCFESYGVPDSESHRHAALVLLEVLSVCSREGLRVCTASKLRRLLDSSTRVATPRREHDSMVAALAQGVGASARQVAVPVAWEPEADVPLPGGLLPRTALVDGIASSLAGRGIAVLHGGSGTGKTALARLVARKAGGLWSIVDLRDRPAEEAGRLLLQYARRPADGHVGLIADDVPDLHLLGDGSPTVRAVGMLSERGEPLILTGYREPTALGRLALQADPAAMVPVPHLSVHEVRDVVRLAGGDGSWAEEVWLAAREGHPQLVRALVAGLRGRDWPVGQRGELLIRTAPEIAEQLEATRRKLVRAVPEEGSRLLLHRLGLVRGRFPRRVAVAVGAVRPAASLPGERFDGLVGPWIDQVGTDLYRTSPLVMAEDGGVLSPEEEKEVHRSVAEALPLGNGIEVAQVDSILFHGTKGGARRPLAAVALLVMTSSRETLAGLLPFTLRLRAASTASPLLPEDPQLSVLLRLAQFGLAAARGSSAGASQVADALVKEIKAFGDKVGRTFEAFCLVQMLLQDGFSSDFPGWPALLRRLTVDLGPDIASIDVPEGPPIGPTLLRFSLSTVGSVAQLADAFGAVLAMGDSRTSLLDPVAGAVAAPVVVLAPWIKERDRGDADASRAADEYARLAEAARPLGCREWAVAFHVAAAEVRYQDLHDTEAALGILADAEAGLGTDPWFSRTRQKVLWGERRDVQVVALVHGLRDAFRENPAELSGLLREGAISASRNADHLLASEWFRAADVAAARVDLSSSRALAVGLAADAATESWRHGDRRGALEQLSTVLDRLRALDPESDLQAGYVHRVVRHALLWFGDRSGLVGMQVAGRPPALPEGACSNPDPKASILDLPLQSLDVARYLLAQIAGAADLPDAVPEPRTKLDGGPILAFEVSRAKFLLDQAIGRSDARAFLERLPGAMSGLALMPKLQRDQESPPPPHWERGELPPLPALDATTFRFLQDAILSFRLGAATAGRLQANDALRGALAGTMVPPGEIGRVFPEEGTFGSRSPQACVGLVSRRHVAPADLLECCFRIGMALDRSEFRNVVGPAFVRWAKDQWMDVASNRRSGMRSPALTAPDLIAAAGADGLEIPHLARLVKAALPAVPIVLADDMRRWMLERCSV